MFHTCLLSDVVHFARAYPPLLDRILLISSSGGIIIYPPIFLLSKSKSLRKEEVKIKRLPIYSNLAEEEECTIPVYSLHQVGNKPGEFPIKTCPLRIPEIPRSHHEFETSTYTRIYIYLYIYTRCSSTRALVSSSHEESSIIEKQRGRRRRHPRDYRPVDPKGVIPRTTNLNRDHRPSLPRGHSS